MYGTLTDEMIACITPLVRGKSIIDLGAGNCAKALILKGLGAKSVLAVDKKQMPPADGIEQVQALFADIAYKPFDVGFVSWPCNRHMPGLVPQLACCDTVIYLGSNVGGSACGDVGFFQHIQSRHLILSIPHRRNTLVVVGQSRTGTYQSPEERVARARALLGF